MAISQDEYIEEKTKCFGVRFQKTDIILKALEQAAKNESVKETKYIKQALVMPLQNEGYIGHVELRNPGGQISYPKK